MSDRTAISWTDATWNPVNGCAVVSPGCANCYAMREAERSERLFAGQGKVSPYAGLTRPSKAGAVWTGEVRVNEAAMRLPLRWTRPRRVFVDSMGDLFAEGVDDATIDRVFAVMALAGQHTFQLLTKRPERAAAYFVHLARDALAAGDDPRLTPRRLDAAAVAVTGSPCAGGAIEDVAWPLANLHLGVSVEDQVRADKRIPTLLALPAARRWISAEPLLGSVDVAWALSRNPLDLAAGFLQRGRFSPGLETLRRLDWVVAGGESGPGARPMHPAWVRQLRDDCAAAGVPFDFKQWGDWAPRASISEEAYMAADMGEFHERADFIRGCSCSEGDEDGQMWKVGKRAAGRLLDGVIHDARPEATT